MTSTVVVRRRNRGSKTRRQREAAAECDPVTNEQELPPRPVTILVDPERIWEEQAQVAASATDKRERWCKETYATDPSAFCTHVCAWLADRESLVNATGILVDFGAGTLIDTAKLANALLKRRARHDECWRVVAIEPYGPRYDPATLDHVPANVSICRRDFLAGAGLCRQWWSTPVDIFYIHSVFDVLDKNETHNLWALILFMKPLYICAHIRCGHGLYESADTVQLWIKMWLHYGYVAERQHVDGSSAWILAKRA